MFTEDILQKAGIDGVSLFVEDMAAVVQASEKFNLDFDDAYQWVIAQKYSLSLVSFDSDFDRVTSERLMPSQILSKR